MRTANHLLIAISLLVPVLLASCGKSEGDGDVPDGGTAGAPGAGGRASSGGESSGGGEGGSGGSNVAGSSPMGGAAGGDTCSAGTFDHDANDASSCHEWLTCLAGHQVTEEGSPVTDRACAPCSDGSFSSQENAEVCATWQTCLAGSYVRVFGTDQADRVCNACPPGTRSGDVNAALCASCSSGSFSSQAGAATCQPWTVCLPGTYVAAPGSATRNVACEPCPPGMQSTLPNQSECLPVGACPAGTKQITAAQGDTPAECSECASGRHCAGGTAPELECASGTWDHDQSSVTACVPWTSCVVGTRVSREGSATADRACAACDAGSYSSAENSASCDAWTRCSWSSSGVVRQGTPMSDAVCGAPASSVRQFGSEGNDTANAIAVDGKGNVYVAGTTTGELNGASAGGSDAYLRKYGPGGAVLWTRQFGTALADTASEVGVDAAGNVYVGGTTEGALASQGQKVDAYLRKYNASGSPLWTRQFGWPREGDVRYDDSLAGLRLDASGNVYVAVNSAEWQPVGTASSKHVDSVRKFDGRGNSEEVWESRTSHEEEHVQLRAFARRESGTLYLGGSGWWGPVLFALDANGTHEWSLGVSSGSSVNALDVSPDGGVFAAGRLQVVGGASSFLHQLGSQGSVQWTQHFGATDQDGASSLAVDGEGEVYVGGVTKDSLHGTHQGGKDGYVARYDAHGVLEWGEQLGSSGDDEVTALCTDDQGILYVAGNTTGSLGGQNAGVADVFVRQFSP